MRKRIWMLCDRLVDRPRRIAMAFTAIRHRLAQLNHRKKRRRKYWPNQNQFQLGECAWLSCAKRTGIALCLTKSDRGTVAYIGSHHDRRCCPANIFHSIFHHFRGRTAFRTLWKSESTCAQRPQWQRLLPIGEEKRFTQCRKRPGGTNIQPISTMREHGCGACHAMQWACMVVIPHIDMLPVNVAIVARNCNRRCRCQSRSILLVAHLYIILRSPVNEEREQPK